MKTASFVFLLTILSAYASPFKGVKLEYRFVLGDDYTMTQVTRQTIKQIIMGTEQGGENAYSGEMNFKVIEITSSGARLETQFLKLKNSSKTVMGDVTMDSEGAEDNPQNKVFKTMMKKPFVITMNKAGIVENVEGAENLWSGMDDLGLDEATLNTMKQTLEQLLGENSLKNSFEQAMVFYADKNVSKGDTWDSKNAFPMEFPIVVNNSWILSEVSGSTAKVDAEGIYTTIDKEKPINLPNGIKAKIDLKGKQSIRSNVT